MPVIYYILKRWVSPCLLWFKHERTGKFVRKHSKMNNYYKTYLQTFKFKQLLSGLTWEQIENPLYITCNIDYTN